MDVMERPRYQAAIDDICKLNWRRLNDAEMVSVAWGYYYFSVQFRENLLIACQLLPGDHKLQELKAGECDTDNLSPWPGVAEVGEAMNHDEFMRRLLMLSPIDDGKRRQLESTGEAYLAQVHKFDSLSRALSIASYEDGGLESIFRAILTSESWNGQLLQAFRHFLVEHIRFDSDPEQGHGALSRHLAPDDRILPLWQGFHDLLVECAPRLAA